MNKSEVKAKVKELLDAGVGKTATFEQLTGQGLKDARLAYEVAAWLDPALRERYYGQVNALVVVMLLLTLLGMAAGYGAAQQLSAAWVRWLVVIMSGGGPLLFAWGFYRCRAGFFTAYIVLVLTQMPRQFEGFIHGRSGFAVVSMLLSIALLAFVWFLRSRLFPDLGIFSAKKVGGRYVFSN